MLDNTNSGAPAPITSDAATTGMAAAAAARSGLCIGFTILTKAGNGLLSKRIALDATGQLVVDGGACVMWTGKARRASATGADATAAMASLADTVNGLGSSEALTLGSLRHDLADDVEITTARQEGNGKVSRTQANFAYLPDKPALLLIDFDRKGMPDAVARRIDAAGGLWDLLC
jgi:hypothetical protein